MFTSPMSNQNLEFEVFNLPDFKNSISVFIFLDFTSEQKLILYLIEKKIQKPSNERTVQIIQCK